MNKDLQDIIILLLTKEFGSSFMQTLVKISNLNKDELAIINKHGSSIFWYYALYEFIKGRRTNKDWEFNYLAMSFLRIAAVQTEETKLQQKMIYFIYHQNLANAKDVQDYIVRAVSYNALNNITDKIRLLCENIKEYKVSSKKEFYIIAGANGTGKSTLAQQLIAEKHSKGNNICFINADEIARELNPQDIDKVKIQAGKVALKRAVETLKNNQSFIVESTISGRIKESEYSLKTLIRKAKEAGYDINLSYIYLDSSALCKERIKVRVAKKGHNVPGNDVERR